MTLPISDILEAMRGKRVVVVGDVMLDRFVYGRTERVSPEAPSLVLAADRQEEMLGGAANVALNLASLAAQCTLVGVVGADAVAADLKAKLARSPNITASLAVDRKRGTTLKVRFVNPQYNTHLLRMDWEITSPVTGDALASLTERAVAAIADCDAVVISDYLKGVIQPTLMRAIVDAAAARGVPVVVDPKGRDFSRYSGATVVAPNLAEIVTALGYAVPKDDASVEAAAARISSMSGIATVVVKRSQDGVQIVHDGRTTARFPTIARRVVDVSGAGDTLVATLALALAAGADVTSSVRIANAAAGLVVSKSGTASTDLAELAQVLLRRRHHEISPKIFNSVSSLKERVSDWQERGFSVGFTNGCFDLLHPGHVFVLTESRDRVDRLVLALNTDASVRRLKGPTRPVQNEVARMTVAAALEAVDAVILFDEDTPLSLITALKPNVLFKGGDYDIDSVVGRDVVEANGGRVELIEYLPNTSTTLMIKRMAETTDVPNKPVVVA
jgi:D-beta-D-heptose 7-phosphate kinase/D-beta-D-heptose 1-phosphate adenosyltransferase